MKASVSYSTLHDICHDYENCRSVLDDKQEEKEMRELCLVIGISLEDLMEIYDESFQINTGVHDFDFDYDHYFQEMLNDSIGPMNSNQELAIQKFANGGISCC